MQKPLLRRVSVAVPDVRQARMPCVRLPEVTRALSNFHFAAKTVLPSVLETRYMDCTLGDRWTMLEETTSGKRIASPSMGSSSLRSKRRRFCVLNQHPQSTMRHRFLYEGQINYRLLSCGRQSNISLLPLESSPVL